jgi:hypothetical protein
MLMICRIKLRRMTLGPLWLKRSLRVTALAIELFPGQRRRFAICRHQLY